MPAPLKVLVSCPPMLGAMAEFQPLLARQGLEAVTPSLVQTLSEAELIALLPTCDGWIAGDDPANDRVLSAGRAGRLRAVVKWGVGTDNIDFAACRRLGLPVSNTPGMFGQEVADIAMSYVTALARQTFAIDRGVRSGQWPKPAGISLAGRTVALVGFGDIGRQTARRLLAAEMKVVAYDPAFRPTAGLAAVESATWPARLEEADFLVVTCSLTPSNRHLIDAAALARCRPGVRVVNVSRGPLIDEGALAETLQRGHVHSAALDVFEVEPLPANSPLRALADRCVFGSHNGSNTIDAVRRASHQAIALLAGFLRPSPAP